jgi:nucleoside-diphosphate-sugar epimerase
MRVLVTGSNGFVGNRVVARLLGRGHRVRALVRPAASLSGVTWADEVELARADLRDREGLDAAVADVDAVVHLAAAVTGDDDAQFASTVVGTERLLAALHGAPVRRVVQASSFSVYDWQRARRSIDERTPLVGEPARLDERGGYTLAKVWQERLVRAAAAEQGFELVVLRPGFVWAAGHEPLAGVGARIGSVELVFGPRRPLPITYVENCAERFAAAVDAPAAAGRTLNVVDHEPVSAWRFAREQRRRSGGGATLVPVPHALARLAPRAAQAISRRAFGAGGKLPSLLLPARFDARYKPLRFPVDALEEVLGPAPFRFAAALEREYGPPL